MSNKDLSLQPFQLGKDSWLYETNGGLEVHVQLEGQPHQTILIPWTKIRRAMKRKDKPMCQAILTALSGPSEERRKILAGHLYSWWSTYDFSELHKENYDQIRALILGHAALSGPSEEERADMAEYVRELYVGSHNPVENVPDKEGHYPCKFKWCAEKYDKLIKFILGHAAGEGEKEGKDEKS